MDFTIIIYEQSYFGCIPRIKEGFPFAIQAFIWATVQRVSNVYHFKIFGVPKCCTSI